MRRVDKAIIYDNASIPAYLDELETEASFCLGAADACYIDPDIYPITNADRHSIRLASEESVLPEIYNPPRAVLIMIAWDDSQGDRNARRNVTDALARIRRQCGAVHERNEYIWGQAREITTSRRERLFERMRNGRTGANYRSYDTRDAPSEIVSLDPMFEARVHRYEERQQSQQDRQSQQERQDRILRTAFGRRRDRQRTTPSRNDRRLSEIIGLDPTGLGPQQRESAIRRQQAFERQQQQEREAQAAVPKVIDWNNITTWRSPAADGSVVTWPIEEMTDRHIWETINWVINECCNLFRQYAHTAVYYADDVPALAAKRWISKQPAFRKLVQVALRRRLSFTEKTYRYLKDYLLKDDEAKDNIEVVEPWNNPAVAEQQQDISAILDKPLQEIDPIATYGKPFRNIELD